MRYKSAYAKLRRVSRHSLNVVGADSLLSCAHSRTPSEDEQIGGFILVQPSLRLKLVRLIEDFWFVAIVRYRHGNGSSCGNDVVFVL
jgi:hypothetical protein